VSEESGLSPLPIEQITLENFLSYGPGPYTFDLRSLNVLIGPNGSGKTNLIEAFEVLRAAPKDVFRPFRTGGGLATWIFNENRNAWTRNTATLEIVSRWLVDVPDAWCSVSYRIGFMHFDGRGEVDFESIAVTSKNEAPDPSFYLRRRGSEAELKQASEGGWADREVSELDRSLSTLAQIRDPGSYPHLAHIGDRLGAIQIFRSWTFGPRAIARSGCSPDVRTDRLEEDFSNLPARLQEMRRKPAVKRRFQQLLGELAPGYEDFEVFPQGGALHLYLTEGEHNISAQRLSDGTLRYLCLLAILLDPPNGGVIIIEEPELGLHPDMLGTLRDLLVEASETAQIIITTHSTMLVDAFTEHPESIVVCEKPEGSTSLRRLSRADVDGWSDKGSLGLLWMSGQFGGTRW